MKLQFCVLLSEEDFFFGNYKIWVFIHGFDYLRYKGFLFFFTYSLRFLDYATMLMNIYCKINMLVIVMDAVVCVSLATMLHEHCEIYINIYMH